MKKNIENNEPFETNFFFWEIKTVLFLFLVQILLFTNRIFFKKKSQIPSKFQVYFVLKSKFRKIHKSKFQFVSNLSSLFITALFKRLQKKKCAVGKNSQNSKVKFFSFLACRVIST